MLKKYKYGSIQAKFFLSISYSIEANKQPSKIINIKNIKIGKNKIKIVVITLLE
jgi:hypothetical protein